MLRRVSKSAPTEYSKSGLRLFSWLPKTERTDFSSDGSVSSASTFEDEEAQRNFDWETKYNRLPLKILGLWPLDNQSYGHLRFFIFLVHILMYTLPTIFALAITGAIESGEKRRLQVFEIFPSIYTVVQFCIFKSQSSRVKTIVETIYDNWKKSVKLSSEEKKKMTEYGRQSRTMTAMIMGFYIMACIAFFSKPLISTLMEEQPMRKLPNFGFYPFPSNVSPNFEIVYAMQAFDGCVCALAITSIDGFFLLSVFHGCGQLSLLCKTIYSYEGRIRHEPSLGSNEKDDIRMDCSCLKCIVDRHVSIGQYLQVVDDVFQSIILARLIMNTAHFCGVGYTIVKSNEDRNFAGILLNVFYLMTLTSNLFMYCWVGEQLMTEGENVGISVYDLHWYKKEPKIAQTLLLPILRSRKPMQITAGRFFIISFECYKEWFMKSVGYLSVLLAIQTRTS